MSPVLRLLYQQHLASSIDKQRFLLELIGDDPGLIDLKAGVITFARRFRWKIQILGIESVATRSWIWAWANEAANIPAPLLKGVEVLHAWGAEKGADELDKPVMSLSEIESATIGVVASGCLKGDAFYRSP